MSILMNFSYSISKNFHIQKHFEIKFSTDTIPNIFKLLFKTYFVSEFYEKSNQCDTLYGSKNHV